MRAESMKPKFVITAAVSASLAPASGSAWEAVQKFGVKREYAAFLSACNDARELVGTWKRMAGVCEPGPGKLALESCALDLDRLSESWVSAQPNDKLRDGATERRPSSQET